MFQTCFDRFSPGEDEGVFRTTVSEKVFSGCAEKLERMSVSPSMGFRNVSIPVMSQNRRKTRQLSEKVQIKPLDGAGGDGYCSLD